MLIQIILKFYYWFPFNNPFLQIFLGTELGGLIWVEWGLKSKTELKDVCMYKIDTVRKFSSKNTVFHFLKIMQVNGHSLAFDSNKFDFFFHLGTQELFT
jgi:hypothetical protein